MVAIIQTSYGGGDTGTLLFPSIQGSFTQNCVRLKCKFSTIEIVPSFFYIEYLSLPGILFPAQRLQMLENLRLIKSEELHCQKRNRERRRNFAFTGSFRY